MTKAMIVCIYIVSPSAVKSQKVTYYPTKICIATLQHPVAVFDKFSCYIDCEPIGKFTTVSLHAIQFTLFTNPTKIYLVGIDCTAHTAGHFTGETKIFMDEKQTEYVVDKSVEDWKICKEFCLSLYIQSHLRESCQTEGHLQGLMSGRRE